jgi:uncharacterized caspase-like protein
MGHNLAIVIGINEYERLKKLKYAKQDALKIKGFLEERGEVESVLLFTDDSEPIDGKPTRATHTNLRDLFVSRFDEQFLDAEDNLWFFFSGHGLRHDQRDYLLPIDGNPRDIDGTCITVDFVTKRLSRSGAGNIVLILDACRSASEGAKGVEALGEDSRERVRERGLISIFACRPDEQSWEEDALGQGLFTFALMKALEEGSCATVRQINSYLKSEVAALAKRYGKAPQTPWLVAEPIEKADLILSLKNVKEADLHGLKKAALEQEVEENFDSALELWNRVNIASQGRDTQFYAAFKRIEGKRQRTLLEVVRRQLGEQERLQAEQRQREQQERLEAEQRQREQQERLEAEQRQCEEKERLEAEQREKERLEVEQRQQEETRALEAQSAQRMEGAQFEGEGRRDRAERVRPETQNYGHEKPERLKPEQRQNEAWIKFKYYLNSRALRAVALILILALIGLVFLRFLVGSKKAPRISNSTPAATLWANPTSTSDDQIRAENEKALARLSPSSTPTSTSDDQIRAENEKALARLSPSSTPTSTSDDQIRAENEKALARLSPSSTPTSTSDDQIRAENEKALARLPRSSP